eukprot:9465837-Alexandrium_andersonii.AAC.1
MQRGPRIGQHTRYLGPVHVHAAQDDSQGSQGRRARNRGDKLDAQVHGQTRPKHVRGAAQQQGVHKEGAGEYGTAEALEG